MTSQPKGQTRLWSTAGSAVALCCLAAACETPRPTGAITPATAPEPARTAGAALGAVPLDQVPGYQPKILNPEAVVQAMLDGYPPAHREQGAQLVVRFVIDAEGVPQDVQVIEGAEISDFNDAAVKSMQQARFTAPPKPVFAMIPVVFSPQKRPGTTAVKAGDYGAVTVTSEGKPDPSYDTPELIRMRELFQKHKGDKGQARYTIQPDGSVTNLTIVRSTGDPVVDEAFIASLRRNRFRPSEAITINTPIVPNYATKP